MNLLYRDKEIKLVECTSIFSRFKGFMLCKNIDKALLFCKCNSIHTFFMIKPIDVICCDSENRILYYYQNVGSNRIIWPKKGVCRIYELPPFYFDVVIGDRLEIR